MEFLLQILVVYGISAIVTISKIFEPIRDLAEKFSPNFWKHLTSCMQCFPFWAGIFVAIFMGKPFELNNEGIPNIVNIFLDYLFIGALFSGTTLLIHTLFVHLKGKQWDKRQESERKRKIKKGILKES